MHTREGALIFGCAVVIAAVAAGVVHAREEAVPAPVAETEFMDGAGWYGLGCDEPEPGEPVAGEPAPAQDYSPGAHCGLGFSGPPLQ